MQKFFNILEKYGVDKYEYAIDFEKNIEPDGNDYSICLKTNTWHEIEFFFHNNSFQLSEIFREEYYDLEKSVYYLIFYDYNHYHNKNNDVVVEKFSNEEDADTRRRELSISYLGRLLEPKWEIIRFR